MSDDPSRPLPEHPDEAIPLLLDAYGRRILDLGLHMCRNREDAEDVVQETFLRAYRAWPQFKSESSPATWLYTIAVRTCKRLRRRRAGEPLRLESLSDMRPSEAEAVGQGGNGEGGPLDHLLREETRRVVQGAITRIPLQFRLALVLKDIGGLSVSQISRVLGIKESTVKTRLHRARLHLADALQRHMERHDDGTVELDQQVCLDLLRGKQEALDRGEVFPVDPNTLCDRCRTIFEALQMGRDACARIADGEFPQRLRKIVLGEIERAV